MQHIQYKSLLDQILVRLNSMVKEKGPAGKAFACGDPLNDPAIPSERVEYFFALGNIIERDGKKRINVPPANDKDRVVWTSQCLIRHPGHPLVMNYHVLDVPDQPECPDYPLEKIHYISDVTDMVAEHIYGFIIDGDLPKRSQTMQ